MFEHVYDEELPEIPELALMGFDVMIQPGVEEEPEKDQPSKSEGKVLTITLE